MRLPSDRIGLGFAGCRPGGDDCDAELEARRRYDNVQMRSRAFAASFLDSGLRGQGSRICTENNPVMRCDCRLVSFMIRSYGMRRVYVYAYDVYEVELLAMTQKTSGENST